MPGRIIPQDEYVFRELVDAVKSPEGIRLYELATRVEDGSPLIYSIATKQWYGLSWNEIIDMAVAAGLDKKKKEEEPGH